MIKKQLKKNNSARQIYMIGIKGVGMTMLAQFLQEEGNIVLGSDIVDSFLTDKVLSDHGIKVLAPFSVANLPPKPDLIIYSSAFNAQNNPELRLIEKDDRYQLIPRLSYAEALGELFSLRQGIAVCGSHGKTTTSAWLGYVLERAGKSPSVLVGSRVPQFKGSSLRGQSRLMVAEVDEYQNKLRYFSPQGVVLNNIDYDHPDFFKNEADYVQVFVDFIKKIPPTGFLVVNHRDILSRQVAKKVKGQVLSYDISNNGYNGETVNYLAHSIYQKGGYQYFQINNLGEFKINLLGEHNIFNALAVVAAARQLKVSLKNIKKHLVGFKGTERRAQVLGAYRGAIIIDDYAHHPTEVKATLEGIRQRYPQRTLRVIFHPHTFTRTKALFNDFVSSFSLAKELVILNIYGSAREKQGGVSSAQLVKAIKAANLKVGIKQQVSNLKDIETATKYLQQTISPNDLVLLMGAGDVFRVADGLLKRTKKKGDNKLK